MAGSMYIRVKRTNQTIFLYVEPTNTIGEVKKKISAIIKTPSNNIRLLNLQKTPLEDEKTITDYKIENESIVYWVQKKEGTNEWEEPNIQKLDPSSKEEVKE